MALDAQHGLYDDAALSQTLLNLASVATPVFVRLADDSPAGIGRVLDAGAAGVIVPLIDTPEQAAAVAAACRYPPRGGRSWGPLPAQFARPAPTPDQANQSVLCAVMVETAAGLAAVERIATTTGVDMVFVGPFDLSLALGLDVDDLLADHSPTSPLERVVRACAAAGIRAGAFGGSPDRADQLARFGFTDIVVVTDAALLAEATAREMARWTGQSLVQ